MLRSPVAAFVVSVCLVGNLFWGGIAQAADGVFCENPSNPLSCTIVVSAPGNGGTSQGDGAGDGAGGIKPNDGSGSAANYVASKGDAAAGSPEATAGDSRPITSTECDWTAMTPAPGAGDPRWGGADPAANSIIQNNCNGPTRYAVVPNGAAAGGGGRRRLLLRRHRTPRSWLSRPSDNCESRSLEFIWVPMPTELR